jgi:hypothetical protein
VSIVVDKLTIGSAAIDSAASSIAFTTTQAVAASGFITLDVGAFFNSAAGQTVTGVSGGSLTWTIDKQAVTSIPGGGALIAKVRAPAPSGLASGTTITATFSASAVGGRSIAGSSFTGVATSSPVDGTPPAIATFSSTTAWATGSATITAGSLVSGMAYQATTNLTSTPTSPSLEEYDINGGAGSFSATGAYRIEASSGSFTVAGTWSGSCSGVAAVVAYLAASGGGADQNITGAGAIASSEAIGSHTVTPGDVTVSPSGIASAEAIGTHTVTPGAVTVSPSGIASAEAVGSHTVTPGGLTLSPTGIASAEAVGTAVVTPGAVTVSPTGIASGEVVSTGDVVTVGLSITGAGAIGSAEAIGSHTLTPGPVTISPTGIPSGEAFGSPTITGGTSPTSQSTRLIMTGVGN